MRVIMAVSPLPAAMPARATAEILTAVRRDKRDGLPEG
jgi:hypothetical protein